MKTTLLSLCLCCLITSGTLPAQETSLPFIKVEYIGLSDGLPNREIKLIAQDKQGFFWISTRTGVYRYDGYQFIHLRNLAKNGKLVPSSQTQIFTLPNGNLLFLVDDAQFFNYDPFKNEITVHPLHRLMGSKVLSVCNACVFIENEGAFLFEQRLNGFQYLIRYLDEGSIVKIDSVPYSSDHHSYILEDAAGNLFWGTAGAGIRRYTPDGKPGGSLQISGTSSQNNPVFLHQFFLDAKERMFVSVMSGNKLLQWDWKNDRVLPAKLTYDAFYPHCIVRHAGNTWLGELKKFWLLDEDDRLHDLTGFLLEKEKFEVLRMILVDAQEQIWVATDNGIFRLSTSRGQFTRYMSSPQPQWAKTTRGFFEDNNGTVYFRCENCGNLGSNSIYKIDRMTGEVIPVPFSCDNEPAEGVFIWVKRFYKLPGKNIVWAVGKYGLVKLDLDTRTASLHKGVNAALVNNAASVVASGMTRKGEILAGGKLSQLFAFDPVTEKYRFLIPKGVKNEQEGYVSAILEASDGTIWAGLHRGLHRLDPARGVIIQSYGIETHPAFLSQEIQLLTEDHDGTIWAAGYGGGIVHIFPETGKAEGFTHAAGLSDDIVAAILPYGEDYLWISTFNGLSCFNKKEKSFVNFYEEDGLSHNEFNFTSAYIDSKGRYYFGGMNGVNAFYPEEILKPRQVALPLLLTGFSFYDEKKDTLTEQFGGLQSLTEVTLSPHVSWFQLNFALASYTNPKLNKFKTRLDGFEKDWTYQGTTPFIRYNRLPAGDYTLHIKAADSKGYWSENELTIRITVQQVFYKTWWFILLVCLATGVGIFALARFRFQQKLALERMRTRIASDLHDEVGSSLSHLNLLVGSFDVKNDPERTATAAEKAREVMSRTASNIRDVVWAIDARRDKTGDLLDRMEDFAFDMLGNRDITYQFHTDGIRRDGTLSPFVRQNIYLIYKEAVNNIAKHSSATQVDIRLRQTGNELELTVADNGHSLNHSKVKGQGLENMHLRAERIGGKVEIKKGEDGFFVKLSVSS